MRNSTNNELFDALHAILPYCQRLYEMHPKQSGVFFELLQEGTEIIKMHPIMSRIVGIQISQRRFWEPSVEIFLNSREEDIPDTCLHYYHIPWLILLYSRTEFPTPELNWATLNRKSPKSKLRLIE